MKNVPLTKEAGKAYLLKQGYYPDISYMGIQAFLAACQGGMKDIVNAYLAIGMSPNVFSTASFDTPLIRAMKGKKANVVEPLLSYGADLEKVDGNGDTPFIIAVAQAPIAYWRFMAKKGSNVNVYSRLYGWTPLSKALRAESEDEVITLLSHGANPNFDANGAILSPLLYALKCRSSIFVDRLLDAGANPNVVFPSNGLSALSYCILNRYDKHIQLLLEAGANPHHVSKFGWSPWMIAKWVQNQDLVEKLEQTYEVERRESYAHALTGMVIGKKYLELEACFAEGKSVNVQTLKGKTPLIVAIQRGDAMMAAWLLDKGANPHLVDENGKSALCHACEWRALDTIELLLERYSYHHRPAHYLKALKIGAGRKHISVVKMLIEAGLPKRVRTMYRELDETTLLELITYEEYYGALFALLEGKAMEGEVYGQWLVKCAEQRKLCAMDWLISQGVELNAVDEVGRTALWHLCSKGHTSAELDRPLIKKLLEHGADYTLTCKYLMSPIAQARQTNHKPAIAEIQHFVTWGQIERIKSQLSLEDTDSKEVFQAFAATQNYDSLMEWVELGQHIIVEGLLHCGIDPNPSEIRREHPLEIAFKQGNWTMLSLLLQHGADPNCELMVGITPFHKAVETGDIAVVELFLNAGADVQKQHHRKGTALHMAARLGDLDILLLLYNKGAKVDPNPVGISPLAIAAATNKLEAAKWLINKGAKVCISNHIGETPLTYSVAKRYSGMCKLLLENGANPNDICNGQPVLIMAIRRTDWDCVKLLLDHGADPMLKDKDGSNAYSYTERHIILFELLKKR